MNKKLSGTFVPMYHKTLASPAWRSLPHGARSLFVLMKRMYNRDQQGPVYLSARYAAKELGASKSTIMSWLTALLAGGFIVKTKRGGLGLTGKGRAAEFQITDEPFKGKLAAPKFLEPVPKIGTPCTKNWDTPVPKIGTPPKTPIKSPYQKLVHI